MTGAPKKQRRRFVIEREEVKFFESALESDSALWRKHALQRLCALYRRGGRITAPTKLKGLVIQALTDRDRKVKRWAFNALAQLGTVADVPLMKGPWIEARSDREIFEAGLTALASILPREQLDAVLAANAVRLDAAALMALGQKSAAFDRELAAVRLDIDRADDMELRSAALLIGLQKAPPQLFSDKYLVPDVIGELNSHNDPIVAQYSYWAKVEHPELGIKNARVLPSDFPSLPPNVQGWAYRLITKNSIVAMEYYDAIIDGSTSDHPEVRDGIAVGIRDVFFDSLDTTVCDWMIDEHDPNIRDRLLEHMATHSSKSSEYRNHVLLAFQNSHPNSVLRARLEAANKDPSLGLEFRKIALQTSDTALFAAISGVTMNNTMNFNSTVNSGVISNSGHVTTGDVSINDPQAAQELVVACLREFLELVDKATPSDSLRVGSQLAADAALSPTKGRVSKFLEWLKAFSDGGKAASGLISTAALTYDKVAPFLERLPDMP